VLEVGEVELLAPNHVELDNPLKHILSPLKQQMVDKHVHQQMEQQELLIVTLKHVHLLIVLEIGELGPNVQPLVVLVINNKSTLLLPLHLMVEPLALMLINLYKQEPAMKELAHQDLLIVLEVGETPLHVPPFVEAEPRKKRSSSQHPLQMEAHVLMLMEQNELLTVIPSLAHL